MYDNNCEEYIRNMIGLNNDTQNDFDFNNRIYESDFNNYYKDYRYDYKFNTEEYNSLYSINSELERFYPEVYKLVYPMVQKACIKNSRSISKESIDDMVEEIYSSFSSNETKITENDNIQENRNGRNNNSILSDLIKILILRELMGRPGRPPCIPGRPCVPGNNWYPNRPPYFNM